MDPDPDLKIFETLYPNTHEMNVDPNPVFEEANNSRDAVCIVKRTRHEIS